MIDIDKQFPQMFSNKTIEDVLLAEELFGIDELERYAKELKEKK